MGKIKLLLLLFLLLCLDIAISQTQPTSITNKLFLSPFYRDSMLQNTNYTYLVVLQSPDGMSKIKSAILTLDAWIQPTRTAYAWVNGIACNNPSYTISTTYATSGKGLFLFDCSNAVKPNQENIVTIRITGGNIGSNTAYLEVTYENNPKAKLEIYGTEYYFGQQQKVWLQLINNTGDYVNSGVCYVDIYTPNNQEYIEKAEMNNMNHDGIYYYDLVLPDIEGIYPVIARCYYEAGQTNYYVSEHSFIYGSLTKQNPYNFYDENGNNRTNLVLYAEDGLAHSRNIDGIGRAQRIVSEVPLYNGDQIRIRVYGDAVKNIVFSDSTLSTIYATQPITLTYNYYDVTLSNIGSGGITTIYASDGTQAGALVVTWDYIAVNTGTTTLNYTDLMYDDTKYIRIKEQNVSNMFRLDYEFNVTGLSSCANVPESLLTSVSLHINSRFNSVTGDYINMFIYNFSNNKWINLGNKVSPSLIFNDISNTLFINNITKAGIYNPSTQKVRIKLNDTFITDTSSSEHQINHLVFSCNQLANPSWQEVKGSSEIHLNNPISLISNLNTTNIAQEIWNWEGIIHDNILTRIAEAVWNFAYRYIHGEER